MVKTRLQIELDFIGKPDAIIIVVPCSELNLIHIRDFAMDFGQVL